MLTSTLQRLTWPSTYVPLTLALLAGSLYLTSSGALVDPWGALDLKTFRIFAVLLLVMMSTGLVRAAQRHRQDGIFPILSHAAALAVLLSALTVYLFRFEGTMIMAEGEAYEPLAAAYSDIRKGPLARVPAPVFVLSEVAPSGQQENFTIIPGAGGRSEASTDKVLITDGTLIRLVKRGIVPLVELSAAGGGTVAREYVRLDLDSPVGQDSFMFVNNPYEFTVKRSKDSADPAGVVLQIAARRGKLKVAEGKVGTRIPLKVDAITLSIPEVKRSAIFQVSRRTGYGGFLVACAAFLAVHGWGICLGLRRWQAGNREN